LRCSELEGSRVVPAGGSPAVVASARTAAAGIGSDSSADPDHHTNQGTAMAKTAEHRRLEENRTGAADWLAWGPYLSERQWGTVREDYSDDGDAWDYFPHDQARSRAYRWGEDGIAGICDARQRLCFSLALWNGVDPILKERMFGLTNSQGNHGEDVKEYWFYLDSTPTHSYLKMLYKYPQRAFPYVDLVATNGGRSKDDFEYELIDTGIFDESRYFDVFVEYAKAAPGDILVEVTVHNRGPEAATLHLLPTLWFRNTWSWGTGGEKPLLEHAATAGGAATVRASHPELGEWSLRCEESAELLFCENETNNERLFNAVNVAEYVKDGINDYVVAGDTGAVNPAHVGTKVAALHRLELEPGASARTRVRLASASAGPSSQRPGRPLGAGFDRVLKARRKEADAFYAKVIDPSLGEDAANVMRQALAGMLWSKQYYEYDVHTWLAEHGVNPWSAHAKSTGVRNAPWFHLDSGDVISMPDKWEYPWFAAWDLALQTVPLSLVDVDFAKGQMELLLKDRYLHPNGQIPAYEWNFSDVNPPLHAWSALYLYEREREIRGAGDAEFLERVFQRLLTNFTWWVNRKDPDGRNLFQGGFLGLDNIGVFDRSAPLPGGGSLEQADGTAWMALYCQAMLQMALELTPRDPAYASMASKFILHFVWISAAMSPPDGDTLWDEEDGFYYDVIRLPDGSTQELRVRSLVGLLPMCAATVIEPELLERLPDLVRLWDGFIEKYGASVPALGQLPGPSVGGKRLASLVGVDRLRRILAIMLDESEFLGPHGIRAISKYHAEHPYVFDIAGQEFRVDYEPAESHTGMFGGNSNWRGPVWFPMNIVILRGLRQLHEYYGDNLKLECPTGSGNVMNLSQVAEEIGRRLASTFLRDENGRRPVFGGIERFQSDPHWRDLLLFHEYFHGDNGAGLGASHQTGWTGLVALLFAQAADARTGREQSTLTSAL
jgi:hypothetical protein